MKKGLILFFVIWLDVYAQAQNIDKQIFRAYDKLEEVSSQSLQTSYLLNKGFFFGQGLEAYRAFEKENLKEGMQFISPDQWKDLCYRLSLSQVMGKQVLLEEYVKQVLEWQGQKEGVVPIGVIQATGEWLQHYEVDEAIKAKQKGYQLSKAYEKLGIYAASILRDKVYTGNVSFQLLPDLFWLEDTELVESIWIDPSDEQGYRKVNAGDKINVQYDSPGEKSVAIKFRLDGREFVCYSVLNVVTLEKKKPDMVFNLNTDGTMENGRTEGLSGGTAELHVGCDAVFDRPVIVVEGFDPLNETNIGDVIEDLNDGFVHEVFYSHGYDMVYLDYADGGARIQDNAKVLEELIHQVNAHKTGNQSIVVIGISMGGLVSRYALTSLEEKGFTHNVSHFISFDSPHLGANVPVAFQKLVDDVYDIEVRKLLGIAKDDIDNGRKSINAPAARQMLLRYKGTDPHPDFTQLQNELKALGFPKQNGIRNISIISGSSLGKNQEPVNNFKPNDILFEVNYDWVTLNADIIARTNHINGASTISSIIIRAGIVPTTKKERRYTFNAFNYDIAPGGYADNEGYGSKEYGWWINIVNFYEWFGNTLDDHGRPNFCFVPLFSSVASTAPRKVQSDLNIPINQLMKNKQTPFDTIYAENDNYFHVEANPIILQWSNLFSKEFGIPYSVGCFVPQGSATAPQPRFNTKKWYACPNEILYFNVVDGVAFEDLYTYNWKAWGDKLGTKTAEGEKFSVVQRQPGTYNVQLTRSYSSLSGVKGTSSSYTRTVKVFPPWNPNYCDGLIDDGDGNIPRLAEPEPGLSYEKSDREQGIDTWPNPVGELLNIRFTIPEEGKVKISLHAINSIRSKQITITNSWRPQGNYTENYYTHAIPNGTYLLTIQTDNKKMQRKIIIQK